MNMPENSYQNQKNLFAENYDLEHDIAEEFFRGAASEGSATGRRRIMKVSF